MFPKPYQKRKIGRIFMQIYKKNEHLYIVFCINTRFWWAEVDSKHFRLLQSFILKGFTTMPQLCPKQISPLFYTFFQYLNAKNYCHQGCYECNISNATPIILSRLSAINNGTFKTFPSNDKFLKDNLTISGVSSEYCFS